MKPIQYGVPIEDLSGFHADAVRGNTVYEVLLAPKDARRLRTALMELARVAASDYMSHAVLVVEEPEISTSRLLKEWEGALSVIRPELSQRLSLNFRCSGEWNGTPNPPNNDEIQALEEIIKHEISRRPIGVSRNSEAHYEILRILIHQWLLNQGPISINCLMKTSGSSHPTVSRSLERLGHYLKRHSDRSVELRTFPRDEWSRLLAVSDDVRGTVRFTNRSSHVRPSESLLHRLHLLERKDIALGGTFGAKHYQPSLDLIGNPRLDISIHTGRKALDLSFVERLDPALEQITQRNEPPTLVIHIIRRAESLFQLNEDGIPWADPVECLLDLHEARLESQALEFINSFPTTKNHPL